MVAYVLAPDARRRVKKIAVAGRAARPSCVITREMLHYLALWPASASACSTGSTDVGVLKQPIRARVRVASGQDRN